MPYKVGHDFVDWLREASVRLPRLWFILGCVVAAWLIAGLIVIAVLSLAR